MQDARPWIPEMHDIFRIKNPHYPIDVEMDYPALRKIGEFILRQNGHDITEPLTEKSRAVLMANFKKFARAVSKDNRLRRSSLDRIAKFSMQEVYMMMNEPDEPKKMIL